MLVTRGGGPGAITLNFSDSDRYSAPSRRRQRSYKANYSGDRSKLLQLSPRTRINKLSTYGHGAIADLGCSRKIGE